MRSQVRGFGKVANMFLEVLCPRLDVAGCVWGLKVEFGGLKISLGSIPCRGGRGKQQSWPVLRQPFLPLGQLAVTVFLSLRALPLWTRLRARCLGMVNGSGMLQGHLELNAW